MKARLRNLWDRLFYKPESLTPGVYQTTLNLEGQSPFRVHLRIENEGAGILILNAKTVLHLNKTATEFARFLIQDTPQEQVAAEMEKRYRILKDEAIADYQKFVGQLEALRLTPDLDPEIYLDIDRVDPHSQEFSAPLRVDCALTYKMSDGAPDENAPSDRVARNLDTEEWKSILQKAWDAGIPHVIFTGGEPTLRPDLIELVQFGENLGMVTGLITDGMRLTEKEYLHHLLQSGLDHMMLILDPSENQSWEALKDALQEDISVSVHLTLTPANVDSLPGILDKILRCGKPEISLSVESQDSKQLLPAAQQVVNSHGLALVWGLPVPYSANNPVKFELEDAQIPTNGAGSSWLYIEPDGDVLPGQGIRTVLGNFVSDPFETIWSKAREFLHSK